MSEPLRPEQSHDQIDEEEPGEDQGDPVKRAHEVRSVESQTAISASVRTIITRTRATQKRSMSGSFRVPLDDGPASERCPEAHGPHQAPIKTRFARRWPPRALGPSISVVNSRRAARR